MALPAARGARGASRSMTSGSGRSSTRFGIVKTCNALRSALCQLSSDGVAEPSKSECLPAGPHHGDIAGMVARRRSCLKLPSCSSSMTMSPSLRVARRRRCGRRRPLAPGPRRPPPVPPRSASPRWLCSTATSPQATAEALDRLRRQADLGHQHDRFLALADHFLDGAQVNFGFAAAGDAVQKKRVKPALPHSRLDCAHTRS